MSLETAIAENTAVLHTVAELLKASNDTRLEAIGKLGEMGTVALEPGKPRAGRPTKAAQDALAKSEAAEAAELAAKKAAVEPASTPVATIDELRAAAVKFLGVDGDEKVKRKDFLKAVIEELGIPEVDGKRQITSAEPDDRQKIITWFADFADGKAVNFSAEDGAAPDDDDIG